LDHDAWRRLLPETPEADPEPARLLPPAHVWRRRRGAPRVPLIWPVARATERLVWVLRLERGDQREGAVRPVDLPILTGAPDDEVRRHALALPPVPDGYHRLELWPESGATEPLAVCTLIATPRRAFLPPSLEGEDVRIWGPAQPLASLRSGRQWGRGDLGDLTALVDGVAELGAGLVAVGGMSAGGDRPGPVAWSRRFLDPHALDVTGVSVFAACEPARKLVRSAAFQARLAAMRELDRVAAAEVAALHDEVLDLLWDHFRRHELDAGTELGREFVAYRDGGGHELWAFAVHEVLCEHRRQPWPRWPAPLRDPHGEAVVAFAREQADAVARVQWVQWEVARQLAGVGRRCQELGLRVGLVRDLPAAIDPAGPDAWLAGEALAAGVVTSAGGAALRPDRLRDLGYAPLVQALRAAMREAGAVRLQDLASWVAPRWRPADDPQGEAVPAPLPLDDLVGLIALESRRQRCLVIAGTDDATPAEVADALADAGILVTSDLLSTRDREGRLPVSPDRRPAAAALAVGHDESPTLVAWWRGRDLADLSAQDRAAPAAERAADRVRLLADLAAAEVLPEDVTVDPLDPGAVAELGDAHLAAVHAYLATAPSRLLLVRLDDVLGVSIPAAPGDAGASGAAAEEALLDGPRKLPVTVAELLQDERLQTTARLLRPERGRGRVQPEPAADTPAVPAIPRATYRLQLGPEFGFARVAELVPYLQRLGVSHCYASPFLRARPGSSHGYDIIDHNALNPEYGTPEDFDHLTATLAAAGMGLILDHVPNHMGVGSDNAWWMDVLEHGPASPRAGFFDIDWRPRKEELHGRVVLPILEDHFGRVLGRGLLQLQLDAERGEIAVHYWEHRFPLDPRTYPQVLALSSDQHAALAAADEAAALEYRSLVEALAGLPARDDLEPTQVAARRRDQRVHKRRLARLLREQPLLAQLVGENVAALNGTPDHPETMTALGNLLEDQAYRLAYWRVAGDEINYRRFFDINDLAGLRMENDEVFEATHGLVLDLIARGQLHGLRLDHLDGLYDPAGYGHTLRTRLGEEIAARRGIAAESAGDEVYVVVEKILAEHERLPADWPVHGTTGYEFARLVGGLFVDGAQERALDRVYTRFVGHRVDYEELLYQSKLLIMRTSLASELNVLADGLDRLSEADWRTRDFTRSKLREALREVVACFPIYRTYLGDGEPSSDDVRHVEWAVARARRRSRAVDLSAFDFLQDVLLGRVQGDAWPDLRARVRHFARRLQQFTGPVTAKGMEDTTFYLYNRLLALNEVGGEPDRVGVSVAAFHHVNRERLRHWPHAMLGTSTHDSKRSEDVRARIGVLSEVPDRWGEAVARWSTLNRRHRKKVGGALAPSRNDEFAFYQNLLGVWPQDPPQGEDREEIVGRLRAAMLKSVREGKRHSSWINPDAGYEEALGRFIDRALDPTTGEHFLAEFEPFCRRVVHHGRLGSLAQTLIKLTAPGVPDLYQGTEVWAESLVDPDNRRPVDHAANAARLDRLAATRGEGGPEAVVRTLLEGPHDGRAKLWLSWRALELRRIHPELFRDGEYLPVEAVGERADHVVAFARVIDGEACLVVVPRLTAGLCGWEDASLPLGRDVWGETVLVLPEPLRGVLLVDELSGAEFDVAPDRRTLLVADVLAEFPAALLTVGEEAGD
jgi:(1->4)-alpha-D-glucan 1-alpha-D-glucosylmutase